MNALSVDHRAVKPSGESSRRLLNALANGAATAPDLAAHLDLDPNAVSWLLLHLARRGQVSRVRAHPLGRRGRPSFVYFLDD